MSKAKLKAELAKMSREQLAQMILDAYDARPETKEYFEFFINPDIEKLFEKFEKKLVKELQRTKWGRSKARVTVVKRLLADVMTLGMGPQADLDLLFLTLRNIAAAERVVELTDTQRRLAAWLVEKILETADSAQVYGPTRQRLEDFLDSPGCRQPFAQYLRTGSTIFVRN